jgi:UDP-N-acetyl-D-mannosaminuronic acid transferase (WecB/TagA/CpsF family)
MKDVLPLGRVNFMPFTWREFVETIERNLRENTAIHVHFANAFNVVLADKDQAYATIVEGGDG